MIPGILLALFLTVPLITNSENSFSFGISEAVLLKVNSLWHYRQFPVYDFLTLQWCWSNVCSVGTGLRILNFDLRLAPGLVMCCTVHSPVAGQWAAAPSQARDHNQYFTVNCVGSVFGTLFWVFAFHHVYKTAICVSLFWWERGRQFTLEMKLKIIGLLKANVSVPTTYHVARLSYDVWWIRCVKCIFSLWYFQINSGFIGI